MFAVLKWSVNGLLNTCYREFKHILKILSSETILNESSKPPLNTTHFFNIAHLLLNCLK